MRITSLLYIVTIAAGLGLGACTGDEQVPGDDLATQNRTPEIVQVPESTPDTEAPEGTYEGDEYQARACRVKLVYCKDPRWSPHYPSFCSNGCDPDHAFSVARSLCHRRCGHINCNTMYTLGGC